MENLQKNFFWVSVCGSLLLIHILFVAFEANIYTYLFWPYVSVMLITLVLSAIVFSRMESVMKVVTPNLAIAKYKRILGSLSFWSLFVFFTFCIGFAIFSLGQLFLPKDLVSHLIIDKFVYWAWSIYFILCSLVAIFISKGLKLVIYAKTK